MPQFIKFGVVGVLNTVISLLVYYVLTIMGVHYIISNAAAFVISVLNAYYWNLKYVFIRHISAGHIKGLIKVYVSYGVTFLLGSGLLFIFVDIAGVSKYIAPVLNLFVTVPINFLLCKFWVYKI